MIIFLQNCNDASSVSQGGRSRVGEDLGDLADLGVSDITVSRTIVVHITFFNPFIHVDNPRLPLGWRILHGYHMRALKPLSLRRSMQRHTGDFSICR